MKASDSCVNSLALSRSIGRKNSINLVCTLITSAIPMSVSILRIAADSLPRISASELLAKRSPSGFSAILRLISATWRYRFAICSSLVSVSPTFCSSHLPSAIHRLTVMRATPTRSAISCCVRFSFKCLIPLPFHIKCTAKLVCFYRVCKSQPHDKTL